MNEVEQALQNSGGPYLCGKTFTAAWVTEQARAVPFHAIEGKRRITYFHSIPIPSHSDIAVAYSCEYVLIKQIGMKGKDENTWPLIMKWLFKVEDRPAYKEALKRGAKYDFSLLDQEQKKQQK